MNKQKKYRVIGRNGIACPQCGRQMEIREHTYLTEKQLRQPYYFTRWFYCFYQDCPVKAHMQEEYKVWLDKKEQRAMSAYQEHKDQLSFISKLT